jgi:hypothetical protein
MSADVHLDVEPYALPVTGTLPKDGGQRSADMERIAGVSSNAVYSSQRLGSLAKVEGVEMVQLVPMTEDG